MKGINVPIFDGVTLTGIGAAIDFPPVSTAKTITGSADVTFGPSISGKALLSTTALLKRTFPSGATPGNYVFTGSMTALPGTGSALVLGSGSLTLSDTGDVAFQVNLGGGASSQLTIGPVTLFGFVKGDITNGAFSLKGKATVTVPGLSPLSMNMMSNSKGVAACVTVSSGKVGFQYLWDGTVTYENTKGCTEAGF